MASAKDLDDYFSLAKKQVVNMNNDNQVACVDKPSIARIENNQSADLAIHNSKEKSELIIELKKELIEKQKYTLELNDKIAQLEGCSIDNTPLTTEEKEKVSRLKEHRKKATSHYSHKSHYYNGDRHDLSQAGVYDATGSPDLSFGLSIIGKCVQSSSIGKEDKDEFDLHYNSIVNALNSLKPQDEIEGMLISRMIALHFQSMHYLSCAANGESSTQGRELNINRSVKLSRLYNETLDALSKYRRKGEQRVVVQHVNVENGGKAVVGGVFEGGVGQQKNCEVIP